MNVVIDNAVQFFRNLFNDIQPSAEEISFVNGKMEEICFNYKDPQPFAILDNFRIIREAFFSDIEIRTIEAFSFQRSDGTVYKEDKFVIMVNTGKKDCFLYPQMTCFNPWPDYYINLTVPSLNKYVKFMDMDLINSITIPLPEGVKILGKFGAGIWSDINLDLVGVYLEAEDYDVVPEFFKMTPPVSSDMYPLLNAQARHIFGLVVDRHTLEPKKLNYYCYPNGERPDF